MNPFDDRFNSELLRQLQRTRELFDNPALRHAQRTQDLFANPALQASLEFQRRHGHLFEFWDKFTNSEHFRAVKQTEEYYRNINTHSSAALHATRKFLEQDSVARRIMSSNQLRVGFENPPYGLSFNNVATARAVSEVTQFINRNAYLPTFPQSFSAEVLNALSEIEEPIDEESFQQFQAGLENLLRLIVEKCKQLAADPNTYWAMVKFAFTISLFLYPLYDNHQGEKRITDTLNQTQTSILKEVEKLQPSQVTDVYCVVEREAKLKVSPRPRSASVQILAPNQTLRLIETKGKWIYVEYFDYIQGVPRTGWVLKKYTKRINSPDGKLTPATASSRSQLQVSEAALLSEQSLAEDWNRTEEDEAWSHLQLAP